MFRPIPTGSCRKSSERDLARRSTPCQSLSYHYRENVPNGFVGIGFSVVMNNVESDKHHAINEDVRDGMTETEWKFFFLFNVIHECQSLSITNAPTNRGGMNAIASSDRCVAFTPFIGLSPLFNNLI